MDRPVLIEARKERRNRCRLDSRVSFLRQAADCRILNISRVGLAVELYSAFHAATGSLVQVENAQIGLLEGVVRWSRGGRLGIQFRQNSNSIAKVDAYFRYFHREVTPVLRG